MLLNICVNFYLTWKCNFQCKHCQYSCCPEETLEMSIEQIQYAKNILRELLTKTTSKVSVIGLSGGEPMLHSNFWKIVDDLKIIQTKGQNSFPLELHTNGSQPISQDDMNAHFKYFKTSYVACDMFHDEFRQNTKFNELSNISEQVILRRADGRYRGECANSIRLIGRAKENYEELSENYRQLGHFCMHRSYLNGASLCFTPDKIKFCTEIGRGEYTENNSADYYTYTLDELIHKSIEYSLYHTGEDCKTKCFSKLVQKSDL